MKHLLSLPFSFENRRTKSVSRASFMLSLASLIFYLFSATHAQAQSAVGKIYADHSVLGNGSRTHKTISGNLMGGIAPTIPGSLALVDPGPMIIRTDPNGGFTSSSNFNKTYKFVHSGSNNPLQVNSSRVIELADGSGYVAISSYSVFDPNYGPPGGSTRHGLIYMEVDLSGNVVAYRVRTFITSFVIIDELSVTSLEQMVPTTIVNGLDHFLIAGEVKSGENIYPFAMRMATGGGFYWFHIFDFNTGTSPTQAKSYDIIENPYNSDIYVVGDIDMPGQPWHSHDAWCLTLDPISGNPTNSQFYDLGEGEGFTSIAVSDDPNLSGFILCGYSNTAQINSGLMWALKTDVNNGIQWSYTYDNADFPGLVQTPYDIKGRLGSSGNYEYYMAGGINSNVRDAFLFKIHDNGLPAGAIDIADLGGADYALSLDFDKVKPVGIFGRHTHVISQTAYSFFNYNCFINHYLPIETAFSPGIYTRNVTVHTIAGVNDGTYVGAISNNDYLYCNQPFIKEDEEPTYQQGIISPNPATQNTAIASVELMTENPVTVDVGIFDMLGRQYYKGSFDIKSGKNRLPLDVSTANMAPGTYVVKITGGHVNQKILLMIE